MNPGQVCCLREALQSFFPFSPAVSLADYMPAIPVILLIVMSHRFLATPSDVPPTPDEPPNLARSRAARFSDANFF